MQHSGDDWIAKATPGSGLSDGAGCCRRHASSGPDARGDCRVSGPGPAGGNGTGDIAWGRPAEIPAALRTDVPATRATEREHQREA
jgi:hypothetical protein